MDSGIFLLIASWTLLWVFVFSAIAACLGMVGIIKFPYPEMLRRLFNGLIIQAVIIFVGLVSGFFNLAESVPDNAVTQSSSSNVVASEPEDVLLVGTDTSPRPTDHGDLLPARPDEQADLTSPPDLSQESAKITVKKTGPIAFDEMNIGDEIVVELKNADVGRKFTLYDTEPRGVFGKMGAKMGELPLGEVLKIQDTHVTRVKKFKWLRAKFTSVDEPKQGWFSWENQLTNTYKKN